MSLPGQPRGKCRERHANGSGHGITLTRCYGVNYPIAWRDADRCVKAALAVFAEFVNERGQGEEQTGVAASFGAEEQPSQMCRRQSQRGISLRFFAGEAT
jgi:hypothetical protein